MTTFLRAVTIITTTVVIGAAQAGTHWQVSAAAPPMQLTATDFGYLRAIPVKHGAGSAAGCPGSNVPVSLRWTNVPPGTKSLALTMVDYTVPAPPGFFVHWIVYNIPPTWSGLDPATLSRVSQGVNGTGSVGYFGPCPPPIPPQPHVYTLRLYALTLVLPRERTTLHRLQREMKGHMLAVAPFAGTFGNPPQ